MDIDVKDFTWPRYLDKTTILYGETGTGKSFIITDILYKLKNYVDQIIVVSPTDRQNHTYDKGLVPLPCIHYQLTESLLDEIWNRQTALGQVYAQVNKEGVIKSLFDIVAEQKEIDIIKISKNKLAQAKKEILDNSNNDPTSLANIKDMEKMHSHFIDIVMKRSIIKNRHILDSKNLSEDQKYTLKYLELNPRLVWIFDDCSAVLKKFKTHKVIQELFYQGRWAYITAIIACHTDKALDPELKKNAFNSVFTESSCAYGYYNRKSNDIDPEAKKRAIIACKNTFSPTNPFQKLIWSREDKKFYKSTAAMHDNFTFGNRHLWEYCNRIQVDNSTSNISNKYMDYFV